MVKMKTLLITSLILFSFESNSQKTIRIIPDIIEYKKVDTISLDLHIYRPLNFDNSKKYKTIIFFHGGGWRNGNPRQFRRHAMYFASRGMIAITPEYRLFNTHGTSPLNCVQDANAVMNFIKKMQKNLGINSKEIVVSGGSAGGHLALTTAFWNVSSVIPKALILFNPVTDTSPKGFGFKRNLDDAFQISPIHNVRKNCPPSIILIGTDDEVTPLQDINEFKRVVEEKGGRCDVVSYDGQKHGFFNSQKYFKKTTYEVDKFLSSLGFLNGEPSIYSQYK